MVDLFVGSICIFGLCFLFYWIIIRPLWKIDDEEWNRIEKGLEKQAWENFVKDLEQQRIRPGSKWKHKEFGYWDSVRGVDSDGIVWLSGNPTGLCVKAFLTKYEEIPTMRFKEGDLVTNGTLIRKVLKAFPEYDLYLLSETNDYYKYGFTYRENEMQNYDYRVYTPEKHLTVSEIESKLGYEPGTLRIKK